MKRRKIFINIQIIMWGIILILCIINTFKQIFIPEITKDATIIFVVLITYILIDEIENKYLREVIAIQDETINEAIGIIQEIKEESEKRKKVRVTN